MPIDELDLSLRSYNCLKRAGINYVEDLIDKTENDLMKVRNLGRMNLEEIKQKLNEMGLCLRDQTLGKENINPLTKIENLRLALQCLLDEYIQYTDNACHCNEYGDNEECSYCFAKRILKETNK